MEDHTSNIELKPCPMCGQREVLVLGYQGTEIRWVECLKCGIQTARFIGEKKAAESWNSRVQEVQNA
jgi:Lar family restriction alleviation protein